MEDAREKQLRPEVTGPHLAVDEDLTPRRRICRIQTDRPEAVRYGLNAPTYAAAM
jgi:hypothetical protein